MKKEDNKNNSSAEKITYMIVAGGICCYFLEPLNIAMLGVSGVMLWSMSEIVAILKKYKNIEDTDFVEREKIEHFKK